MPNRDGPEMNLSQPGVESKHPSGQSCPHARPRLHPGHRSARWRLVGRRRHRRGRRAPGWLGRRSDAGASGGLGSGPSAIRQRMLRDLFNRHDPPAAMPRISCWESRARSRASIRGSCAGEVAGSTVMTAITRTSAGAAPVSRRSQVQQRPCPQTRATCSRQASHTIALCRLRGGHRQRLFARSCHCVKASWVCPVHSWFSRTTTDATGASR